MKKTKRHSAPAAAADWERRQDGGAGGSRPAAPSEPGPEQEKHGASWDNPRNQDGIRADELLVVSFGTSYSASRRRTIGAIEAAMEAAFPAYSVRRAFTSQVITGLVKSRDGVAIDSVGEALERAAANGVKRLAIQPTHLMNGLEYESLVNEAGRWAASFDALSVGAPLLSSGGDFQAVAGVLAGAAAAWGGGKTAVCFMGHGTEAAANAVYARMQQILTDGGHQNVFIGTVEARPALEDVLALVRAGDYERVVLQPMMIVAGDHANNDMAGGGRGSWKSAFEGAGYKVECVVEGLGAYKAIQDLLIRHAQEAVSRLG